MTPSQTPEMEEILLKKKRSCMPTAAWKCRPLHIKALFRWFDIAYNIPYGFCGRKAPWKKEQTRVSEQRHYTTLAVVSLVWTIAKKRGEPGTRSSPSMSTADSVFSSKASELCESPGGRQGSPSLTVLMVSTDVKRDWTWTSKASMLLKV